MSTRPKIVDPHEREVERELDARRKQRDRAIASQGEKAEESGAEPEPQIRSKSVGTPQRIPKAIERWIAEEDGAQMRHYRRIFRDMEKLAPQRERWRQEFFARISGPRGFSVHAGQRRTIPKKELPKRPDRTWRVVW